MIWTIESISPTQVLKGHEHVVETIIYVNSENAKLIFSKSEYGKNEE